MDALLEALRQAVGAGQVLAGADAAPFLTDWRRTRTGAALAVVRPASTEEVAAVVRLCLAHRTPLVPQGGNTGQVAGATPDATGRAVVLWLGRMNRVRAIDPENDTITVEAGCVLQAVQEAARAAGRLFPLSLGAEGSCTIGGNLATNAGGTQVLRYGNARELALGLEVVTAEGRVWHGLRGLRKDNTGYDLRDVYIGSEGTLGVITAATLKLFPLPAARTTALVATSCIEHAVALLARVRRASGAMLTGFELMSGESLALVMRAFPAQRLPYPAGAPWHLLVELSAEEAGARERFERALGEALESGEISDAALSQSEAQSRAFWLLRESITLAIAATGKCLKHDIALPTSRIAAFVRDNGARLQRQFPGIRPIAFGHLGDGNLHYNFMAPEGASDETFAAMGPHVATVVHDHVCELEGSISAEQGIGQLRVDELVRYKDPVALDLMRRIKAAIDPAGIMNPGKVL